MPHNGNYRLKSIEETFMDNRHVDKFDKVDLKRRSIVRKTAVASAALACCSIIPDKWTTPLVEFGTLPAHASTSGLVTALVDELQQEGVIDSDTVEEAKTEIASAQAAEPEPEAQTQEEMYGYKYKEEGVHKGQIHISGNFPERFVFRKDGPDYGGRILLVCDDGQKLEVSNTRNGYVIGPGSRKYVAGYPYFRSNDPSQPHQTMEYYADYSTRPNRCWVYYNG